MGAATETTVSPTELALMLELRRDKGLSYPEIAQRLSRSTETIHRWLKPHEDTRILAKSRLNGSALDLAEKFISKAKPRDVVQMLDRLEVTTPPQTGPQIQQNVLILGGTQPVLPQGMASTLDLVAAYQQQLEPPQADSTAHAIDAVVLRTSESDTEQL